MRTVAAAGADDVMERDRYLGCLLGGALGDALGGRYEGTPGPHQVVWGQPWQLSDDTQLTLATCEAIVERGSPDPAAIAASFARWYSDRRLTGLGAATLGAVTALVKGGHWALVGRRGEMAAGNGAAMRIAPIGLWLDPRTDEGRRLVRDVSRITHHSEEAFAGALAVAMAVYCALSGTVSETATLSAIAASLPDSAVRDRLVELAGRAASLSIENVAANYGCSGYVVESIPLALFAATEAPRIGFAKMLEEVVRAGGDTDSNAAIAGQVAGCAQGLSALPPEHLSQLPHVEELRSTAEAFAAARGRARRG